MHGYEGFRAAVVGGSIGGLFSALLLRELGFSVDVFERTPDQLDHRGGGIVLQPITMQWFDECSGRRDRGAEHAQPRAALPRSGRRRRCTRNRRVALHVVGDLYRALLGDFGREHYHLGEHCSGFTRTPTASS